MKTMILMLASMLAVGGAWAQQPPATVTVWAKHYGGRVVYAYDVLNLSSKPMARFWIGRDISTDAMNGTAELSVAPVSTSPTFWLSPDVGQTPEGWGVSLNYPEESSTFSLECIEAGYYTQLWPSGSVQDAPRPAAGPRVVPPGAVLSGFVVTVPQDDLAYVRGHATFNTGHGFTSVAMTPGDTVAPTVTLNVARLNQNDTNGQWAIFNVTYEASDNYDPLPTTEFRLSSVPAAAPGDIVTDKKGARAWNMKVRNVAGRVYSFQVQSIDASGNVGNKSFTYAIPAAQAR